jgi:hypothetical protein
MKLRQITKVKRSVTFGRFNIGHSGHVELIQKMLDHSEVADVFVSSGSSNNSWDLRVLLLRSLLRREGAPLERVNFLRANSPYRAIRQSLSQAGSPFDLTLFLGDDQKEMGFSLSRTFDIFLSFNRRTNSSTNVRFLLDRNPDSDLLEKVYKGHQYPIRLAHLLRAEEKSHEKLLKPSRKVSESRKKRTKAEAPFATVESPAV